MAKKEKIKKPKKSKFQIPAKVHQPEVDERFVAKPPMTYTRYEEILSKGKRIDWYDTLAPVDLCTSEVRYMASMVMSQYDKLIAEDLFSTVEYRENLLNNVRRMPYTLNADTYLIKKKEIEKRLKLKDTSIGPPPVVKTLTKKQLREEKQKKAALMESKFDELDALPFGKPKLSKEERKAKKMERLTKKLQ